MRCESTDAVVLTCRALTGDAGSLVRLPVDRVAGSAPVSSNGRAVVHSDEPAVSDHGFPAVREACAERAGLCRTGSVSGARAVLLPLRPRVDFAARWFGATRSRTVR